MTKFRFPLIRSFVFTGNFLIPIYAFCLYFFYLKTIVGLFFFFFVTFCIVERAWETFKTSKERRKEEFHGDWPLAAVTGTYLILFFLFIGEFFLRVRSLNLVISGLGIALWFVSLRLRFWGMAALGKQWAVHAVGAQKIRLVRLIKLGPYRYMRHPIYLGIILEVLSFPIIANTKFSFLFAFFVCVPLVVIRAILEEKTSLRRLGPKYENYRREVGMFFPTQLLIKR